ncbi:carboxypeptidase-like regulatory domain-containing protein, partial [Flavobacterium sp. LMO8]|uniref:carboxypeptidase-like regulatory domain-containing protein n=1 Tax=Flavobacterium sp. LMO8 TaxID=2654244 RepID=UPI001EEFB337
YNATKKVGFFSSNRDGVDNIYKADPICNVQALVRVKDAKTGNVIEGATVMLVDEKQKTVSNQTTALNGETLTGVLCNTAYSAQVSKSGYESGVFEVAKAENEQVIVEALLTPIMPIITEKEVILEPIY